MNKIAFKKTFEEEHYFSLPIMFLALICGLMVLIIRDGFNSQFSYFIAPLFVMIILSIKFIVDSYILNNELFPQRVSQTS